MVPLALTGLELDFPSLLPRVRAIWNARLCVGPDPKPHLHHLLLYWSQISENSAPASNTHCLNENPSWSFGKCWVKGRVFNQIHFCRNQACCQISTINITLHTSLVINSSFSCYDSQLGFNLDQALQCQMRQEGSTHLFRPTYLFISELGLPN